MNRRAFLKAAAFGTVSAPFLPAFAESTAYQRPNRDFLDSTIIHDLKPDHFRHSTLASSSNEPVGLRLVCLFDNSTSMNEAEFRTQAEMMADAVTCEDFRHAVFYPGGPQSIAVSFIDLSQNVRIPWLDLRKGDDKKFDTLRQEILDLHKQSTGPTYLRRGLVDSLLLMQNCPWKAQRSVINLITDGTERGGGTSEKTSVAVSEYIKDLADKHEITVNALITLGDSYSPNMEEWARKYYFTKPGHVKKDGTLLDPGFCEVVANDGNDQGRNDYYIRKKAMRMSFRRVAILQVAGINPDTGAVHLAAGAIPHGPGI